ncbi:MAG: COG2426 family protein [Dictyoglomus turgidum]|uniref:COG2426 family protein n=1 Tax=Dictyoglomus turgidum TaxID=513050 RepID=UPI003C73DE7D
MNISLIFKVFLLSMTPVGECRISIPYGIYNGLSPLESFIISFLGNTLMGIIIYNIINWIGKYILSKETLKGYYDSFVRNKLKRLRIYSLGIVFSLAVFVAIPLPGTGAFTGAILARFLGLSLKEAIISITSGVLIASTIVTLLTLSSKVIF